MQSKERYDEGWVYSNEIRSMYFMKTVFILIPVIVVSFILILFALGKYSQKGHAPGLVSGRLSKCSAKPNCVCSEYVDDIGHYIKPVKNPHSVERAALAIASATIQELGGTIQIETDDYIAATFTSPLFGFVDDLEIRNDQSQGVLHLRSASRVGYSDGGANHKRIEIFKKKYILKSDEAVSTD